MLKLRSPIKISLKTDLLSSQEAFCERIKGNYMQLAGYVDETDLLHLVTSPPEVFIAEGGMTSFVQNTNTENNQIRKVNIINNLLNRITVSADSNMSYQDKVYITNILHRLGIKDERKFMKQVYRITKQFKQQNETLKLYWDNLNDIRNIIREYRQTEDIRIKSDTEVLNSNVLHLHEEVNRRLNTAAIYRILQNFYENTSDPRTVSSTEYRISEQERLTRQFVINRLREEVKEEKTPLIYRDENIYESDVQGDEVTNLTEVNERITSAVLLSMIENIYENTYERLNHNIKNWLSTEDIFYGAADNTLFRIENNTAYLQYLHEEYEKNEESQSFYQNESDIINQILSREKTQQLLYQTYQQNMERSESFTRSVNNILRDNRSPKQEESGLERTMRDSMLALEHPEEFREKFEEEERREAQRIETIRTETEKLYSPIERMTHELIREYLRAPERYRYSERISVNNMGLLLHDIMEAESEESPVPAAAQEKATPESIPVEKAQAPRARNAYERTARQQEGDVNINNYNTELSYSDVSNNTDVEYIFPVNETNEYYLNLVERNEEGKSDIIRRAGELTGASAPVTRNEETFEDRSVSIVHRSRETTVSEEQIEDLREEMKRIEETSRNTVTNVRTNETENRTVVNNITNETVENNTREIENMVNRQLRTQLDSISDRVYNRIEKQLKNEQRRRGL